jgi:transposase-like protein
MEVWFSGWYKTTTKAMKRTRRTHSAEFKARVALEALKGVKTVNQIAQEEGKRPTEPLYSGLA